MIWITVILGAVGLVSGQNRFPEREYTNPEEMLLLEEDVSFQEAIDIFEEFSIQFRDKVIIDRSGFTGAIGIPVPRLHWRDALDRIARYNNLMITEGDRYIEISRAPEEQANGQSPGSATPAGTAAQAVNEDINFNTREVQIDATFFEGNRQLIRELGIDWSTLYNGRVRVDNVAATSVADNVFEVEVNWNDVLDYGWDVTALFRTFESSNQGEVISSPSIKVMDGEMGRIQVGQDFSIRQRDFAGNVIDQFFSTGTILEVTPRVLYNEGSPYIYLSVEAERSTASPGAVSTIVNKQMAMTEILLLSGESTVIAGLYETEENQVRRGIPFLKDLPAWFFGLRYLFGYNSTDYSVQELVVMLQVKLVPTLQERMDSAERSIPGMIDEMREQFESLE